MLNNDSRKLEYELSTIIQEGSGHKNIASTVFKLYFRYVA